jgi:hypothetical protein
MTLSLARDSASVTGKTDNLFHGIQLTADPLDETNGRIYMDNEALTSRPDLSYFLTQRRTERSNATTSTAPSLR